MKRNFTISIVIQRYCSLFYKWISIVYRFCLTTSNFVTRNLINYCLTVMINRIIFVNHFTQVFTKLTYFVIKYPIAKPRVSGTNYPTFNTYFTFSSYLKRISRSKDTKILVYLLHSFLFVDLIVFCLKHFLW